MSTWNPKLHSVSSWPMSANVSTTKHSISKIQVTIKSIERRGVMSSYHGSKILGSQQSFLTETTIGMVERWYKSMGYHFVRECNHAQESHIIMSSCSFFPPYLKDQSLLKSRNLATTTTWCNNFSSLLPIQVHKPTLELVISCQSQWHPSIQLPLCCWNHLWTPKDQNQSLLFPSAWKRNN